MSLRDNPPAMSEESRNVELVRACYEAFNRRDGNSLHELWTTDSEWRPAYLGGGLLEGAVYRGPEGLLEFLEVQAEAWGSILADPVELRGLGDRVLAEVHLKVVGRASGITVKRITWSVFELRDGKVAAGRVYSNKEEAFDAVGLSE